MSQSNDSADRRALPRRACHASSCHLWGAVGQQAEVRDLSNLGVGLLCDGPVQPGQLVHLQLTGPITAIGLTMQARVVHAQQRDDGRWLVGCAFDRRLPDDFVALLL